MTSQYDIFISYSHRDSQLAKSLYSKFNAAGLRCFLAEKDIAAAERWESRIRDALRASQRILLLITPNSKDSHWVVAEAGAAWALDKPLIPALAYVDQRLHTEYLTQGKHHAGIILAQQQRYSLGEQIRRLLKIIAAISAEEMKDRIVFLSAW